MANAVASPFRYRRAIATRADDRNSRKEAFGRIIGFEQCCDALQKSSVPATGLLKKFLSLVGSQIESLLENVLLRVGFGRPMHKTILSKINAPQKSLLGQN